MKKGLIFDIQRSSFVDGPGLRTTIFFKGCNNKCAWCHNPEGINDKPQLMFFKDKCVGCGECIKVCPNKTKTCISCGKCASVCLYGARIFVGRYVDETELLSVIEKDRAFYFPDGGVTFSGGECMLQYDFLLSICRKCKSRGINVAIDTAGNVPLRYFEEIEPYCDYFLYDIKCVSSELYKKYIGASANRIEENLAFLLKKCQRKVIVRVPLIPEVNGSESELRKIKGLIDRGNPPLSVEVLPYHDMGVNKFKAIGRECKTFTVPSEEQKALAEKILCGKNE